MRLAGTGIWSGQLRYGESAHTREAAAELEALGYSDANRRVMHAPDEMPDHADCLGAKLSGGAAANLAVHGRAVPEPAARVGDAGEAPKEGPRSIQKLRSPSTSPRPARSSARVDGRCSVHASWRAGKEKCHSNRCARMSRSVGDGTTNPRPPGTRRSRCRSVESWRRCHVCLTSSFLTFWSSRPIRVLTALSPWSQHRNRRYV
jgi:hypothetical protein